MCVGFVWGGRPVRDADLECPSKSVSPLLCLALQGRPSSLQCTQIRKDVYLCVRVCAHLLMCACFCCISGSYCCCSLSWEVGLTTFLLGSLEPSRNGHVLIHMQRLSSLLPLFFSFLSWKLLPTSFCTVPSVHLN